MRTECLTVKCSQHKAVSLQGSSFSAAQDSSLSAAQGSSPRAFQRDSPGAVQVSSLSAPHVGGVSGLVGAEEQPVAITADRHKTYSETDLAEMETGLHTLPRLWLYRC